MIPIDVPLQTVDAPAVENQVYVVPGVNWNLGATRIADEIEVLDDPEHFYSLEMADAEDPLPAAEAQAAQPPATIMPGGPATKAKRKVLIKRKHVRAAGGARHPACRCP